LNNIKEELQILNAEMSILTGLIAHSIEIMDKSNTLAQRQLYKLDELKILKSQLSKIGYQLEKVR